MEWMEVKINTVSDGVELLTGFLMFHGVKNVRVIDDVSVSRFLLDHPLNWDYKDNDDFNNEAAEVIFYLQDDETGKNILNKIETALAEFIQNTHEVDMGSTHLVSSSVNDDDWLHEWKKTYVSFFVTDNIVISPIWEEYEKKGNEIVFRINPGAVFGTGLHETTRLCIRALEKHESLKNSKVLDIGCGSGILSVIALLLGASSATACDIDPGAARCANENAALNNIEKSEYTVITGNVFEDDSFICEKYDFVLANIVADVIIDLSALLDKYLKQDGIFIASGIIDDRVEDVKSSLIKKGMEIISCDFDNGWYCITSKWKN